ncbi:uncharacterized protein KY384_003480 [Bacidia gigantensis]|uniref:uncharacterized protein n=1 Tax=Bacidia gigantensis TaxID=2732470 RepID=UPI001D03FD45|nr:uncharacterized protein KY384_003480 [Bacidia gigantensis]KAG8531844.1 hypothetical protein KY384_003480 [Bacidia gigantensis]
MDELPTELVDIVVNHLVAGPNVDLTDAYHLSLTNKRLHGMIYPDISLRVHAIITKMFHPPWDLPPHLSKKLLHRETFSPLWQLYDYYVSIIQLPEDLQRLAVKITISKDPVAFPFRKRATYRLSSLNPEVYEVCPLWQRLHAESRTDAMNDVKARIEGLKFSILEGMCWRRQPLMALSLELAAIWNGLDLRYDRRTRKLIIERKKTK